MAKSTSKPTSKPPAHVRRAHPQEPSMSTTNLRTLAVAVAAIIAVLTGVAVGLLSGERTCTITQSAATGQPPAGSTTTVAPTGTSGDSGGGAIGGAQQGASHTAGAEKPAPPPQNATQNPTNGTTNNQAAPA